MSKDNTRAMTGGPIRIVDGKPTVGEPIPMPCPKCRKTEVTILKDNDDMRVMACDDCGAVGVITKGKNAGWWYHDWAYPADMAPGWAKTVFARNQ